MTAAESSTWLGHRNINSTFGAKMNFDFLVPLICGLASGFAWNLVYRLVQAHLNHRHLPEVTFLLLGVYVGLLFVPCLRDFVLIASASGAIAAIFATHWDE